MTQNNNKLRPLAKTRFELGRQVSFALPEWKDIGLKPSDADIKYAAQKLGISQAEAWRAWQEYTWGNKSEVLFRLKPKPLAIERQTK